MNEIYKRFSQEDFNKTYKGTNSFCDTKYFRKFLELLEHEEILEHFKFANDILGIPPVRSIINWASDVFNEKMTAQEKQGIGACFGYLYRFIYTEGYVPESVWVGDLDRTGIKTASIFKKGERK